jgi:hypothetical protein
VEVTELATEVGVARLQVGWRWCCSVWGMLFLVEQGGRSFVELTEVQDGWGGVVI